jgi:hypothetical protein
MSPQFEFISSTDRPALLALSTPEYLAKAKAHLVGLGYKVHVAANHEDFLIRFGQIQYQVVVVEELFAASSQIENLTLAYLQSLPMAQRRHSVILLLGQSFYSLNPMQAFQQSVHAVVNPTEIDSLGQIIQKTVADNDLFLHNFREVMMRVAHGKS